MIDPSLHVDRHVSLNPTLHRLRRASRAGVSL
jgi:hypothetical protein